MLPTYSYGREILGASGGSSVYTDKANVANVQRKLHALAMAMGNSAFDPYTDKAKDDGVIGKHTRDAVAAFNKAYGWPDDGSKITDGTLYALENRPEVKAALGGAAPSPDQLSKLDRPLTAPEQKLAVPSQGAVIAPERGALKAGMFGLPWWQVAIGAVGIAAVGYGTYRLTKRRG